MPAERRYFRPAIQHIHTYPDDVLKRAAEPVRTIDGKLVALLEDMAETMYAAPGIGLAAPQVGLGQRVIVLDCDAAEERAEHRGRGLMKLVNPEIVEREGSHRVGGGLPLGARLHRRGDARALACSCAPGRPTRRKIEIEAEELLAVALQHEIDHLDGKLFLDRSRA